MLEEKMIVKERDTLVSALFMSPSATTKQGEFIGVDDHDAQGNASCRASCSGKCGGIC